MLVGCNGHRESHHERQAAYRTTNSSIICMLTQFPNFTFWQRIWMSANCTKDQKEKVSTHKKVNICLWKSFVKGSVWLNLVFSLNGWQFDAKQRTSLALPFETYTHTYNISMRNAKDFVCCCQRNCVLFNISCSYSYETGPMLWWWLRVSFLRSVSFPVWRNADSCRGATRKVRINVNIRFSLKRCYAKDMCCIQSTT